TVKDASAAVWAGTTMGTPNFANVIPFTATNHKMTARVYSPAVGLSIKLKAEVAGQPSQSVETDQLTTVANAWETLTFDFDAQSPATAAFNSAYAYNVASIFFDFGVNGTTQTFYWDDVMMYTQVFAPLNLPITYDDANVNYARVDFDGGTTAVMANPFPGGINTSANVMQMIKNVGQVWGGSKMTLATPIDFSNGTTFKMQVYSNRANCPVLFKLEGPGGVFVEKSVSTTVANAWEDLSWDFTGSASNLYTDIVFIYDLGVMGDGTSNFTFYQDSIRLTSGGGSGLSQIDLPVTFEDSTVDYTLTDFGGNATVLVADPANAANTVAKTLKTAGAQSWAGTTIGTNLGFASVIPFTATERKMSAFVYSPDAGIPVRLKVEVHGIPTQSVETEAVTTVANAWEELEFDFDNEAPGTAAFNAAFPYDMASIFFNFGTDGATAGAKTYYWDDVRFGGVSSIVDPLSSQVSIFPNPTSQTLAVRLPESLLSQNLSYQITDMTGRTVGASKLEQASISVEKLISGVYSLQINTQNGTITKRFVKL
ncbi:MAG: T9SS type A sorting domain-containing protein, partial [Bacteroidia bacterium]